MKGHSTILLTSLILAVLTVQSWAETPAAAPAPGDTTGKSSVAANAAPPNSPATSADIEALKAALAAQQKEIQQLRELLYAHARDKSAPPAPANKTTQPANTIAAPTVAEAPVGAAIPDPAPSAGIPQTSPVGVNLQAGSTDERIRNLERQIKGLGPISFSGDIRLRAEPFFGGPSDESLDRVRGRVRARFNVDADLGSQFRAGLTLASGDLNNPISTNQTLTGFYTRKPIALDQAFVEFTPREFNELTLVGGKFRYPWYNTELTWDKDLNPEGAGETLAFKLDTPVLKRFALVGFQLPFAEVAGTQADNERVAQQITYGGQVQTTWQIAPRIVLSAYSGYYDFHGADSIALALARASSKNPQTPLVGLLPLTSGNTVPNSTYTTTGTTVITIAGKAYPTGVSSITNAQFASKFGLFDNIARLDLDIGHPRWPLSFIGDYVQNTEACGNLPNILPAPADTSTETYKQKLSSPCNSHYRRGYWLEGRIGRLQEKGDMQFGYTRIYIEQEAVLANFNYSEIYQGTDVSQHRFDSFYQFDRNVQLGFTALVGRPLGPKQDWLERLQFDTIFIF